ncbi:DUF418 domain-containing protein [Prevotella sp. 10(H)]|uniref:DUF418 domain-containing protein n=1 Tax=Prevotella sp. 10(H) TaxID=1158294 RepID=UPI0004A73496|nr:DUF418 domain-containing protein [Prevotella sp. 10(H)]
MKRVNVADALRGFAIFGILLMHSYEQFNLFNHLVVDNKLLMFIDAVLGTSVPFVFAGKAYAIFALLFGFSFFIQDNNQLEKGNDFRGRFVWRMVLLFLWGVINSIFYTGDVLVLFSIVGLLLVITARLSDKTILILGIILFLMPLQWGTIVSSLITGESTIGPKLFLEYYYKTIPVLTDGNLLDMVKGVYNSQLYSFYWWTGEGRVFQVAALFMFGMLIGRRKLFINTKENIIFWRKALVIGIICFLPLAGLTSIMNEFVENEVIRHQLKIILGCYSSFAFLAFLMSTFILVYYKSSLGKYLSKFESYGRMSLTMYISQSIIGGFIFYNWGIGISAYLTVTTSILVGLGIFAIQYTFAYYWLKSHKQGPLEYVWKKATWIGKKK